MNGKALKYGGQVADTITLGLYAIAIQGGPHANPTRCLGKCCSDPMYPNIDKIKHINEECPKEIQTEFFIKKPSLSVRQTTRSYSF